MLTFFRKIRKALLESGSTRKYLLYAIGEILLVMIGILLALQVNNWNEWRKDKITERESYRNLLQSLQKDSTELIGIIEMSRKSLENQLEVVKSDFTNLTASLSLKEINQFLWDLDRGIFSFFPKYGAYNTLLHGSNIVTIESSKIKSALIELYDYKYKRYEAADKIIDQKFHFELIPAMSNIGYMAQGGTIHKSVDMSQFESNYLQFASVCQNLYAVHHAGLNLLVAIQQDVNDLLRLINDEVRGKR